MIFAHTVEEKDDEGGGGDANNINYYDAGEPRGLSGSSMKFETDDVTIPSVYLEDAPPILVEPPKSNETKYHSDRLIFVMSRVYLLTKLLRNARN